MTDVLDLWAYCFDTIFAVRPSQLNAFEAFKDVRKLYWPIVASSGGCESPHQIISRLSSIEEVIILTSGTGPKGSAQRTSSLHYNLVKSLTSHRSQQQLKGTVIFVFGRGLLLDHTCQQINESLVQTVAWQALHGTSSLGIDAILGR